MNHPQHTSLTSIIMPAYRMGRYIGEALRTVEAQTRGDWEVLVVDDHAPEDGTGAIVRAFAEKHPDNRVEFIRHPVNQGVSAARNTAIAAAHGEFIAFLDPDDLWHPWHLAELAGILQRDPGLAVAASPIEMFNDGEEEIYWTHRVADWMAEGFPFSLALMNLILPSSALARRDAMLGVGGFDTNPELQHLEDYDLWIRLARAGHRFRFHPKPTAKYRKHPQGASSDRERMFRLHQRLHAKHERFFREGRDGLKTFLGGKLDRARGTAEALESGMEAWSSGPMVRALVALDRVLSWMIGRDSDKDASVKRVPDTGEREKQVARYIVHGGTQVPVTA